MVAMHLRAANDPAGIAELRSAQPVQLTLHSGGRRIALALDLEARRAEVKE